MKDIVPYEEKTAKVLGQTLVRFGCPSFGPRVGIELLEVAKGINKVLERRDLSDEAKNVFLGLRDRIMDVCAIGQAMQGEVLAHCERILKG